MARFRPHRMYPGALLAQECCSYQASTQLLAQMRGDLMVLIHSDRDCSNVISKRRNRVHAEHDYKFLCTNMREDEMVTGQGNRRLREAITLIHQTYNPRLLIVLSTCPTVMIGDNIKNITRKTAKSLGCDAVAQLTHGLKPKSPAEVVDNLYCTLTRAAQASDDGRRARRLNLVGMGLRPDERAEMRSVLAAMDLDVGVVLDDRADLADFLAIGAAGWNVHPGPNMLLSFDEACLKRLDMGAIEVPLPYGARASEAFYRRIAAAVGVDPDVCEAAIAGRRDRAQAVMDQAQSKLAARPGTLRLAYNIGSVRSFDLRRIAHEELGELRFFEELGFETRLFIQGNQAEENWDRTARVLGGLGVEAHFVLFPDPGGLAHFLQPGHFDLWYGAHFLRDQLEQVQLPLLPHHELGLGFDAVAFNVERVMSALATDFYGRFEANVTTPGSVERLDEMLGLGKGVPIPFTSIPSKKPQAVPLDALHLSKAGDTP